MLRVAESELKQIEAQLNSLTIRREAAVLQKGSLKTQQEQTQAQLAFLQRKFSNQALYNWLRGRLAAIYFQFYDLVTTRCLMAEMAYRWETNDESARFIKSGAWQGTYAGLMAGESLMLNLAQYGRCALEARSTGTGSRAHRFPLSCIRRFIQQEFQPTNESGGIGEGR
ncbi:Tc toxin subunit A-related protein [Xenorhabdus nematophila]|uniref:Tc toxin subunit A-related protein n=1 Tax=Xenorhabdus nematophila TaxID=628 RepID=UPI000540F3D7|nr:hypothetical protein XNW1_3080049 [Xenorhabdus nematophila str. Websteri]CEK23899.1 protein of unknown function [Xenorhabdus nematophila AN6/1]